MAPAPQDGIHGEADILIVSGKATMVNDVILFPSGFFAGVREESE
jgi:hypothetical protein